MKKILSILLFVLFTCSGLSAYTVSDRIDYNVMMGQNKFELIIDNKEVGEAVTHCITNGWYNKTNRMIDGRIALDVDATENGQKKQKEVVEYADHIVSAVLVSMAYSCYNKNDPYYFVGVYDTKTFLGVFRYGCGLDFLEDFKLNLDTTPYDTGNFYNVLGCIASILFDRNVEFTVQKELEGFFLGTLQSRSSF